MLTTYRKTPLTPAHRRAAPANPHLDAFIGWLEGRGFQPRRIHHLLRGVHRFSRWAHGAGFTIQELDAKALEAFRHCLQRLQHLLIPAEAQSAGSICPRTTPAGWATECTLA